MILHEKTEFGPTKLMIHMGNAGLDQFSTFMSVTVAVPATSAQTTVAESGEGNAYVNTDAITGLRFILNGVVFKLFSHITMCVDLRTCHLSVSVSLTGSL